ncbi:MAG: ATP-dependent DNA ligase [Candidatus Thorarchaeota archaeon]
MSKKKINDFFLVKPTKSEENIDSSSDQNPLLFLEMCELFEKLQETSSTLEKEDIITQFLKNKYDIIPLKDFLYFYQLSAKDFGDYNFDKETGVSTGIYLQSVSRFLKIDTDELQLRYKGDWGETIQKFMIQKIERKTPSKLSSKRVIDSIFNLTNLTGSGSQKRKIQEIISVLRHSTPLEAKYFTRLILSGSMKTGAKDKLIQRAFFSAFPQLNKFSKKIEYANKVRRLNFGQAILWIFQRQEEKLLSLKMQPGFPIALMLAERGDLDIVSESKKIIEYKYDGFRLQAHFDGKNVKLFTRGFEDFTDALQDIVIAFKLACGNHTLIVDGELLAYNIEDGSVLPFQSIIRRKRKYNREIIAKSMKSEYRIFDIMFLDGEDLTESPLIERRSILERIISPSEKINFSIKIETQDPEKALEFIHRAKAEGHEGGIIKDSQGIYKIGERDKIWSKIKPQTYDIDGALVGGQYGTGKRADMISRLFVAFPDPETDQYETLGVAVGSGMSEDQMIFLRNLLEKEGLPECPTNIRIDSDLAAQVSLWINPERSPIIEIVADSFSWKTPENQMSDENNIPLDENSQLDLTRISLRFPRCKGIREQGKLPNSIPEVISQILLQIKSSKKGEND